MNAINYEYFSNNENPTRALNATSLKWCLSSTDAIDRRKNSRMRMKVQRRLMQECFIEIHQEREQRQKVGYFSNIPRLISMMLFFTI